MTAILLLYNPQTYYFHKELRNLPRSITYADLRVLSGMLLLLRKFLRPTRCYLAFDLTSFHKQHTLRNVPGERRLQLYRGGSIQSNMLALLTALNQEVR